MNCEYCGKEHYGSYASGRFCNRKCSNGYSTKNKRKEINKKVSKTLKGHSNNHSPKGYCHIPEDARKRGGLSTKLKYETKDQLLIDKLLIGVDIGDNSKKLRTVVKSYLIKRDGEKCSECGWDKKNPINNKCHLELDHINGDREDNRLSNFRVLCPNCHSLTATYKGLNHKGKLR